MKLLLPLLFLTSMNNTSTEHGYNYSSVFRMEGNYTLAQDVGGTIDANYEISGFMHWNNDSSYIFEVNYVGVEVNYYTLSGTYDQLLASGTYENTFFIPYGANYQLFESMLEMSTDSTCYVRVRTGTAQSNVHNICTWVIDDDFYAIAIEDEQWEDDVYHHWAYLDMMSNTFMDYLSYQLSYVQTFFGGGTDTQLPGYNVGYNNGYRDGKHDGDRLGYDRGWEQGHHQGYIEGFDEGSSLDQTAVTIFNGILTIAFIPLNFFLAIFNFEFLGINIASFVTSLLTICLVIIVIKGVLGSGGGGEK